MQHCTSGSSGGLGRAGGRSRANISSSSEKVAAACTTGSCLGWHGRRRCGAPFCAALEARIGRARAASLGSATCGHHGAAACARAGLPMIPCIPTVWAALGVGTDEVSGRGQPSIEKLLGPRGHGAELHQKFLACTPWPISAPAANKRALTSGSVLHISQIPRKVTTGRETSVCTMEFGMGIRPGSMHLACHRRVSAGLTEFQSLRGASG